MIYSRKLFQDLTSTIYNCLPLWQYSQYAMHLQYLPNLVQANHHIHQRHIHMAIMNLEQTLYIVPTPMYLGTDKEYQSSYYLVSIKLLKCYVAMYRYDKLATVMRKLRTNYSTVNNENNPISNYLHKILTIVSILPYCHSLAPQTPILPQTYRLSLSSVLAITQLLLSNPYIKRQFVNKLLLSDTPIQRYLLTNNLLGFMYEDIRLTHCFILQNILVDPLFAKHVNYNKLCNKLLERCEKQLKGESYHTLAHYSSTADLHKALTIIIINLIRTHNYIQAYGILEYCFSHKQSSYQAELLGHCQEYILMQLLKAELLEQVQRGTEADDIRQKYAEKVDFGGYVVQSLLLREIGL